jgi:hypothetical protein
MKLEPEATVISIIWRAYTEDASATIVYDHWVYVLITFQR